MTRPPVRRRVLTALFAAVAWLPTAAGADAPSADAVAAALARPILGKGRALAEVKEYVAARVVKTPAVKSVKEWEDYAAATRAEALRRVVFRGPAAAWRDAKGKVEWLDTVETGPGYTLRKLRYEAVPGLWVPALLYAPAGWNTPDRPGKYPVVLNVNGHDAKGKAADYKQVRCVNQARRGMLALNVEWFGMGQLAARDFAHDQINHLDLCGASGVGAFYLAMTRGLDLLLSLAQADPDRVAVTGLSGGGWQTIFVTAFDTRVTLSNPVAGYSSFLTRTEHASDLGDPEQTPNDLGAVTDYAVMTALRAPRPTLLTFNATDNCCFAAGHALPPLLAAARPVYALYGKEKNLTSHVNHDPGTHNYGKDNRQAFYRAVGAHFFPNDKDFDPQEIPADSEVKTPAQLDVPLPADNQTLHGLAVSLAKTLPRDAALPTDFDPGLTWHEAKRARLRAIVRPPSHDAQVVSSTTETAGGVEATHWQLKVGTWSVPAVELLKAGSTPTETVLLVADKGRADAGTAAAARGLVDKGKRVVALDPFYVGEAKPADHDYLYALLLATVGDRALGLQAAEIGAAARWLHRDRKLDHVTVSAVGPRSSVMALTAAGLKDWTFSISSVDLTESLGSLKELVESSAPYSASPELFCFGLLEHLDVAQLAAVAAPKKVRFHQPSARVKAELSGLKAWYGVLGVDHDPLQ